MIAYQCVHHQQVFLVGTAGVGKSTLLNLILLESLQRGHGLLPIYLPRIELGVTGAEAEALAAALWTTMDESQRAKFRAGAGPNPGCVFDMLDLIHAPNLMPLIVFDRTT